MSYHIKLRGQELIELDDRAQYHTQEPALAALIAANIDLAGAPGWEPDQLYWEAARMAKALGGVVVEDPAGAPKGKLPAGVVF
jgi:hypothetical protein